MNTISHYLLDIPLPFNKIQYLYNKKYVFLEDDWGWQIVYNTRGASLFPLFSGIIKEWLKFFVLLRLINIIPSFVLKKLSSFKELLDVLDKYNISWQVILDYAEYDLRKSLVQILLTYDWFSKLISIKNGKD